MSECFGEVLSNNLKILRDSSYNEMRTHLLLALTDSPECTLQLFIEPSTPSQLSTLFNKVEPRTQEIFKRALVALLAEWKPEASTSELLRDLIFLATYVRATDVVKYLRILLVESGMLKKYSEQKRTEIIGEIIGALAGFAPNEEVKELFERFFFDSAYALFAGVMFLSLCEYKPTHYWQYVPRFLQVLSQNPSSLREDFIIRKFTRIVTLKTIGDHFDHVERGYVKEFLSLLCDQSWSLAELVAGSGSGSMYALRARQSNLQETEYNIKIAVPDELDEIDEYQMEGYLMKLRGHKMQREGIVKHLNQLVGV